MAGSRTKEVEINSTKSDTGKRTVEAYVSSDGVWAIHKSVNHLTRNGKPDGWTLTHLPTGMAFVETNIYRQAVDARGDVQSIRGVDWKSITADSLIRQLTTKQLELARLVRLRYQRSN